MRYFLIKLTSGGFPSSIAKEFATYEEAWSAHVEAERHTHLIDFCTEDDLLSGPEGRSILREWDTREE